MNYYPPILHIDNTAYSLSFGIFKDKIKEYLTAFNLKECYLGLDYKNLNNIQLYYMAIIFVHIIYLKGIDVYNTLSLEEIKTKLNYEEIYKCFACRGINLDNIDIQYIIDFVSDDP